MRSGQGFPELRSVLIAEMKAIQQFGITVIERNEHFKAEALFIVYTEVARQAWRITEQPELLHEICNTLIMNLNKKLLTPPSVS